MKLAFTAGMFIVTGSLAYGLMALVTDAPSWACSAVSLLYGQAAANDFGRWLETQK